MDYAATGVIVTVGTGFKASISKATNFYLTFRFVNISFPIFPDEDFRIHKALGEVRTPFFIAIKMDGERAPEIIHTHLGGLTDARAFLDLMVEAYGIKKEDLLIKEATSSPKKSRSDVNLE